MSKPGSPCHTIITPAEPFAFASSNVCWSHVLSAVFRAAYSAGSPPASGAPPPLEHRLLQVPWTLSVAKVTLWNVHRRFSAHGGGDWSGGGAGGGLLVPGHNGAGGAVGVLVFLASGRCVEKRNCRSCCSGSSSLNEPFAGRSQSVQSLSPGVKNAGCWSELKYVSACSYSASLHVVGVWEPAMPLPAFRSPSWIENEMSELFMSAIRFGTPVWACTSE